jgi:hypothetical protein
MRYMPATTRRVKVSASTPDPGVVETPSSQAGIVQYPASAEYDGMLRGAVGAGPVDNGLPPGEMSARFIACAAHASGRPPTPVRHRNEPISGKGGRRLGEWNSTIIQEPGGQIVGLASIGEDTTERKRERKALRLADGLAHALGQRRPGIEALFVPGDTDNVIVHLGVLK